jgi:hypothetical protein
MTGIQSSKTQPAKPPPRKRPVKKPAAPELDVGKMTADEQKQWQDMGCPTMGEALAMIAELQVQLDDLQAELLATPIPAPNSKMLARKAKRSVR